MELDGIGQEGRRRAVAVGILGPRGVRTRPQTRWLELEPADVVRHALDEPAGIRLAAADPAVLLHDMDQLVDHGADV